VSLQSEDEVELRGEELAEVGVAVIDTDEVDDVRLGILCLYPDRFFPPFYVVFVEPSLFSLRSLQFVRCSLLCGRVCDLCVSFVVQ
jgi:hypothetical protein